MARREVIRLPTARIVAPLSRTIREYAAVSERVFFSNHARERMEEREITDIEVIRVLKFGEIAGQPWREEKSEDMACKVVMRQAGGRILGVVTIVVTLTERLLIKTVEWEDLR